MPPQSPYYYPVQPAPAPKGRPWKLIIVLGIFFLITLGLIWFGFWAYGERSFYKNNSDRLIGDAINTVTEQTERAKEEEFAERIKEPYRTYEGPSSLGSVVMKYPQTWSGAVTESDSGNAALDGYFHPGVVPDEKSGTGFALRLEILNDPYDQVVDAYESDAEQGMVSISPYSLPTVSQVLGVRIDGEIEREHRGSAVLLPLRDKTIRISTLSTEFASDFNDIILPNFVFVP